MRARLGSPASGANRRSRCNRSPNLLESYTGHGRGEGSCVNWVTSGSERKMVVNMSHRISFSFVSSVLKTLFALDFCLAESV